MDGWKANVLEKQIAIAAQEALTQGKDPVAAAQERWKQMRIQEAEENTKVNVESDKSALVRRYVLAVCRLGSGRFEGLNVAELTDVAALVAIPIQPIERWTEIIGE